MGLGHDVWNRFSTNQIFGAPWTKNMETKFALGCTARSLDLVPPFPHSSYSFLLVPPSSCFLLLLPSPSFSFLFLPPPSSPFLTLPPPASSFLLVPPSSSSFLILLPFSSSLSLSPFLRRPAQCLPACSATANSHASGATVACRIFGVHPPRELAGCCSSLDTNSMCQNATEHVRMPAKQIR